MILSNMDVDTVLHQILLVVRNYFGTANAAVFLVDAATRELYCRAHIGYGGVFANPQRIRIGPENITGRVAQSKTPVYVPDLRKDPKYVPIDPKGRLALRAHAGKGEPRPEHFALAERSGILAEAFAARMNVVVNDVADRAQWPACFAGTGSELCIPLISFGETLGALVVAHATAHFFSADDRSIAQAAADVCATAIRSVQLAEELRRITHTDSLTGLYNQRYFHVLAAEEIARSKRYHKQFSLLMIELK